MAGSTPVLIDPDHSALLKDMLDNACPADADENGAITVYLELHCVLYEVTYMPGTYDILWVHTSPA